jgi:hypothetical protein
MLYCYTFLFSSSSVPPLKMFGRSGPFVSIALSLLVYYRRGRLDGSKDHEAYRGILEMEEILLR